MKDLTSILVIEELMRRYGVRFSKSLGQNFLTDDQVLRDIVAGAGIDGETGVIEIGPGIGALTRHLAERARKVVAVEIDGRLIPVLKETLGGYSNVAVVNEDVLKTDMARLIEENFGGMRVCFCANLPYYITTPILMMLLEKRLKMDTITVMVQKEVARRLCALPGTADYGAITLAVRYYTRPEILFEVSAGCFTPRPKVDSAVVKMQVLHHPSVKTQDEKLMFRLIRAAFGQRRKLLVNAVSNAGIGYSKEALLHALSRMGIAENARGEQLGVDNYARMADILLSESP